MSWLRGPAARIAAGIAAIFIVTAAAYWFLGSYLDPAGTVLLLFAGASIGFGFAVLLRDSWADR